MCCTAFEYEDLILVAYEIDKSGYLPITVHATTRQQINSRLKSGRYVYEQAKSSDLCKTSQVQIRQNDPISPTKQACAAPLSITVRIFDFS
jgi:hypothetical protein